MKEIPLTQGQVTIVDDDAPAWIFEVKWFAWKRKEGGFYAGRMARCIDGKRRTQLLHTAIAKTPNGLETLHANNDGLDNRGVNLLVGTRKENARGRCKRFKNNTTGRRGVRFNKRLQKFEAYIVHDRKNIYIGLFESLEEAARARDAKARELGWAEEGMNFPRS